MTNTCFFSIVIVVYVNGKKLLFNISHCKLPYFQNAKISLINRVRCMEKSLLVVFYPYISNGSGMKGSMGQAHNYSEVGYEN